MKRPWRTPHDVSESEDEISDCESGPCADGEAPASLSDSELDARAPKRKGDGAPDAELIASGLDSLKRCRIAVSPGELRLRSDLASVEAMLRAQVPPPPVRVRTRADALAVSIDVALREVAGAPLAARVVAAAAAGERGGAADGDALCLLYTSPSPRD